VVAECAHVTVDSPYGRMQQLMMKGARVPADAPELKRLLEIGFVAKVGDEATGGVDATGTPSGAYDVEVPSGATSTPVAKTEEQRKAAQDAADKAKADAEVDEKRAAAKAKLPEGGAAPDGRAAQPVWVEYLVARGSRYEDVKDAEKADLVELAKQQS
jgi:hypothetical protein